MKEIEFNQHIRKMQFIFWGMFFGSGLFLVVSVYLVSNKIVQTNPELASIMTIPLVFICSLSVLTSIFITKSMLKKATELPTIEEKMQKYASITIIRLASVESALIFATVAFMVSGDKNLSYMALAMVLMLRLAKPSKYKVLHELKISEQEIQK